MNLSRSVIEVVSETISGFAFGCVHTWFNIPKCLNSGVGKTGWMGLNCGEMISASQLSEEQKKTMSDWAAQGASIADIQRRLKEDFALSITYMEARFIVLDLGLKLHEEPKEEKKAPEETDSPDAGQAPPPGGGVGVTIDELALPGAIVSGKVTFRDGQTAVWMLDQHGRPALDPDTAGYRPSEEDVLDFQRQLQGLLQKRGF